MEVICILIYTWSFISTLFFTFVMNIYNLRKSTCKVASGITLGNVFEELEFKSHIVEACTLSTIYGRQDFLCLQSAYAWLLQRPNLQHSSNYLSSCRPILYCNPFPISPFWGREGSAHQKKRKRKFHYERVWHFFKGLIHMQHLTLERKMRLVVRRFSLRSFYFCNLWIYCFFVFLYSCLSTRNNEVVCHIPEVRLSFRPRMQIKNGL